MFDLAAMIKLIDRHASSYGRWDGEIVQRICVLLSILPDSSCTAGLYGQFEWWLQHHQDYQRPSSWHLYRRVHPLCWLNGCFDYSLSCCILLIITSVFAGSWCWREKRLLSTETSCKIFSSFTLLLKIMIYFKLQHLVWEWSGFW